MFCLRSHFIYLDLDKIFEWEPLRTDSVISKSAELRCRPPSGNPYPKVRYIYYATIYSLLIAINKQIISIWRLIGFTKNSVSFLSYCRNTISSLLLHVV